ncbi:Probable poly(glycerol-phosphate) alpha-glucosyltransferase [Slackia heliotrinireducens]|uniref:Glycosyltransferase n=1 Tax=Slackia heliotrinireducens (strain ATCC 29202 / DSM 20476 / NCTC 11029 / RHS 1) TaxID=471855 RepID=C7N6G0_SLAHD|nr:glycosyltransferase [Slackia heliotrinireducens]ACV22495.1 glycosyltransferase [Slackia heliotrinireducens DSM 20476]VEH00907.1 Probable poly(glycerol-phosphate) alpha-glucosyltransferase [Slackia heliotrinireducens]
MVEHGERIAFFLCKRLNVNMGGLTHATLNRARVFANHGIRVVVLTMDFNPEYPNIYEALRARHGLPENATFLNIHEFLSGEHYGVEGVETTEMIAGMEVTQFKAECGLSKRIARKPDEVPFDERYYDSNGLMYLARRYDKDKKDYFCIVTANGERRVYPSLLSLRQHFISVLHAKYPDAYFILDSRFHEGVFSDNPFDMSIKKAAVFHASHVRSPMEIDSPLEDLSHRIVTHHEQFDALVFLTERQRSYFQNRYGHRDGTFIIKHPIVEPELKPKDSNGKRAVMVTRLVDTKQVDQAIEAVALAAKSIEGLTLDVYGEGAQMAYLKDMAIQCGVADIVNFRGYVEHASEIVADYDVSLLTSSTEALCLAIPESLVAGTPVIAYDCKFGPAELIQDGVNGRLVPLNNVNALARAIVEVLGNDELLAEMSQHALETRGLFTDDAIMERWEEVLAWMDAREASYADRFLERTAYVEWWEASACVAQLNEAGDFNIRFELDSRIVADCLESEPEVCVYSRDFAMYPRLGNTLKLNPVNGTNIFEVVLTPEQLQGLIDHDKPLALSVHVGTHVHMLEANHAVTHLTRLAFRSVISTTAAKSALKRVLAKTRWAKCFDGQKPWPEMTLATEPAPDVNLHDVASVLASKKFTVCGKAVFEHGTFEHARIVLVAEGEHARLEREVCPDSTGDWKIEVDANDFSKSTGNWKLKLLTYYDTEQRETTKLKGLSVNKVGPAHLLSHQGKRLVVR